MAGAASLVSHLIDVRVRSYACGSVSTRISGGVFVVLPVRTAQRVAGRIREVFLSATAKDLSDPRAQVQQALQLIKADVILQEEWAAAAADAYDLSLRRLAATDAYLGIFGYRYGWIPPGERRSVTELECEEAVRLWGSQTVPPIFLFLPEAGSEAASLLEAAAADILADEYKDDQAGREVSLASQKAFHERLRASGRFINSFTTLQALRERALASVANWNIEILERAASGPQTAVRGIPPSELGAIDRDPQREGLESVLLAVDESSEPGLCVAIHGSEDAGQFAFMSFLEQWNPWDISGKPRSITPSLEQFDSPLLTAAALADIVPLQNAATSTIHDLATALVDRSENEPVVMFLPHLTRFAGGIQAFHQQFWLPLMAAARIRRQVIAAPRRPFILVLPITATMRNPPPTMVEAYDPTASAVDFNRIILLPELEPLTSAHVSKWLESVGIKTLKERKRIADSVTTDTAPRAVFDRLNNDGFWPSLTW